MSVDMFLILLQYGTMCIYILFIARLFKEVIEDSVDNFQWDIRIYQTIIFACLIPYCFVTTLNVIAYFAMFGNLLTFLVLSVVLVVSQSNLVFLPHLLPSLKFN